MPTDENGTNAQTADVHQGAQTTTAAATSAGTNAQHSTQTGADGQTTMTTTGNGKTPLDSLPADIRVYIEELRDEAKKYRLEKQKAERDVKEADEARLAQQNEWKTLAEKRATRIAELEPVELQYKEIQEAFNATLETKLKDIPEDVRKAKVDPVRAVMSPVAFSQWLDAILPELKTRPAPNLDAGAGGSASGKRKLTEKDMKPRAY